MTHETTSAKAAGAATTRNPVCRFRSRRLAESFRRHADKPLWLMLGEHDGEVGVYLVACPADCERLARAGYEYA